MGRAPGRGFFAAEAPRRLFNHETFYGAFESDCRRARKSIVIYSPFATAERIGTWVDVWRGKLAEAVSVRLVLHPPGYGRRWDCDPLREALARLPEAIVIDFRQDMHEKVALIDEETVWHGSLNILSHRDTTESMFRISSSAFWGQLTRYANIWPESQADPSLRENPACPDCGSPTRWKHKGQYGPYFKCLGHGCGGTHNMQKMYRHFRNMHGFEERAGKP